jgi:hypothetical protein
VGRIAEAIAELTEVAKSDPKDPIHKYMLACVYSLAGVQNPAKKQEYGNLAVEQLQEAVGGGYSNHARMATDPDLAPLGDRDDFKKLLAELKKKPMAKPEKKP